MCSSEGNQEVDNGIGQLWHFFATSRSGLGIDLTPQTRQATRVHHAPVWVSLSVCVPVSELWWVVPVPQARSPGRASRGRCRSGCAGIPFPPPSGLTLSPVLLGLFFYLNQNERVSQGKLILFVSLHCLVTGEHTWGAEVWGRMNSSPSCITACNCCELCGSVRWGEWCKVVREMFPEKTEGCTFLCLVCWGRNVCPHWSRAFPAKSWSGSLGVWWEAS